MEAATEFRDLTGNIWFWRAYDPAVRVELSSTACRIGECLVVVDPILLAADAFERLAALGRPHSIVLTNGNHARAAAEFRERLRVPVLAHCRAVSELGLMVDGLIDGDGYIISGLRAIELPGAGPGEIALHVESSSLWIVGDALINLPPHGFTLLPDKYCEDPAMLRRSLRAMLDFPFAGIAFAHGAPVITDADSALRVLLSCR